MMEEHELICLMAASIHAGLLAASGQRLPEDDKLLMLHKIAGAEAIAIRNRVSAEKDRQRPGWPYWIPMTIQGGWAA